jgi:hypothetical protein
VHETRQAEWTDESWKWITLFRRNARLLFSCFICPTFQGPLKRLVNKHHVRNQDVSEPARVELSRSFSSPDGLRIPGMVHLFPSSTHLLWSACAVGDGIAKTNPPTRPILGLLSYALSSAPCSRLFKPAICPTESSNKGYSFIYFIQWQWGLSGPIPNPRTFCIIRASYRAWLSH